MPIAYQRNQTKERSLHLQEQLSSQASYRQRYQFWAIGCGDGVAFYPSTVYYTIPCSLENRDAQYHLLDLRDELLSGSLGSFIFGHPFLRHALLKNRYHQENKNFANQGTQKSGYHNRSMRMGKRLKERVSLEHGSFSASGKSVIFTTSALGLCQ